MIAPMLAGVVYFSILPDYVALLNDLNIKRVFFYSFWAETGNGPETRYHDCHCLAGLTSFANAFKMVVNGDGVSSVDNNSQLTTNRGLVGRKFWDLWKPGKGKIRLIVGQVIDDRPPRSAWVPVEDFLAGTVPSDYALVRYPLKRHTLKLRDMTDDEDNGS